MQTEIIGKDKILKYINKYDFKKIKLSKGSDPVYVKRLKENQVQDDLIDDFSDFIDDFIQPNNFSTYKLELQGSYNEDPRAKLQPVIKATVAFYEKAAVTGESISKNNNLNNNQPIDVDKYLNLAVENATLKAHMDRMQEKLDELISEEEEEEEEPVGSTEPETIGAALNRALISKLDTVVDVVLTRLAMPSQQAYPINGVDSDVYSELKAIHPDIDEDLKRLLHIAKNNPQFFSMLIRTLRNM